MAVDFSTHMFKQMNQDLAFDKRDPNFYWEAMNMELINNGTNLAMVTTSGTELRVDFSPLIEDLSDPDNYSLQYQLINYPFLRSIDTVQAEPVIHNVQTIIGLTTIETDLYMVTVTEHGLNVFWRYDLTSVVVVYAGYAEMSADHPLEIISNYENESVQKLYWVDGFNWFRLLNVAKSNAEVLSTLPIGHLNIATEATLEAPVITGSAPNGSLKAGRIQYGYTLFNRSGQETTLSPLSDIYSILNDDGTGGVENESIDRSISISINNLDIAYDSIRIYSIHYGAIGATQIVSIILDEGLSGDTFNFTDDGNLFVSYSTSDHLVALMGSRYKGGTINTKKNRLFLADYSIDNFDIDFDTRAYSYDTGGTARIVDSTGSNPIDIAQSGPTQDQVPLNFDAVNADESLYYLKSDLINSGGSGEYVSYNHLFTYVDLNDPNKTYLKRGDRYRIGLIFRDNFGSFTPVHWVADTRIPYGSTQANEPNEVTGVSINVNITSAGKTILENQDVVSWTVVMVNRSVEDRDIIAQGYVATTFKVVDEDSTPVDGDYYRPSYIGKEITNSIYGGNLSEDWAWDNVDTTPDALPVSYDFEAFERDIATSTTNNKFSQRRTITRSDKCITFHSPDIDSNTYSTMNASSINIVGSTAMLATGTKSTYILYDSEGVANWGKGHNRLKYTTYDSDPIESLFSSTQADADVCPDLIFGGSDGGQSSYSQEAFLYKNFDNVVYKEYNDITNINLVTNSSLVNFSDTVTLNDNNVYKNSAYISEFNVGGDIPESTNAWSLFSGRLGRRSSESKAQKNVVLQFANSDWHTDTLAWDKFITIPTPDVGSRYLPIVDLKKNIINQYGGNSFEARRRNTYIAISKTQTLSTGGAEPLIQTSTGDCYIGRTYVERSSGEGIFSENAWNVYEVASFISEAYVNSKGRSDSLNSIFTQPYSDLRPTKLEDNFKYYTAYSHLPTAVIFLPRDYNFQSITEYKNTIVASELKYNNEVIDSWTNFLTLETMQLDGQFGSITKLQKLKGELFAFQDFAIAALSILPKIQVQSQDGINLELGTGQVLDDFNYVTTTSGSVNKWSIHSTHDDIIYYDYYNKSISSLKLGAMSTLLGLNTLMIKYHDYNKDTLLNDNPLLNSGVSVAYDTNKKNVYMTMHGSNPLTISYNLVTSGFTSLHSFYPKINIEHNGELLSTDKDSNLYAHLYNYDNVTNRTLYGSSFISYITILSSKDPLFSKMFSNIEYDVKGNNTFNKIEVWNDYQTTGEHPLFIGRSQNMRQLYNKWRVKLGREANTRNVLVDTKAWVKLIHDPDQVDVAGKIKPIDNITLNNIQIKYTR